jgi:Tfp pilus assembly protein PilF
MGKFEQAFQRFETFMARTPRSPFVSDARYWAGICALKLGDVAKARSYISRTYKRPRTAQLGSLALIGLADCDYAKGRFTDATAKYNRALDMAGIQKARILYQLGMCDNRTGKLREAEQRFRKITTSYPNTKYADMAKERLKFSGTIFSVQLGAFSDRENAEDIRTKLARRALSPYIQPLNRKGKILHCVRVGRFKTWKQANEVRKKLKALQFDAVIVP